MELKLHRTVRCSPSQAWRLLTDPEQMNRWSSARIVGTDPGVDDRFDRPGALRTVITPAPIGSVLQEVIVRTQQPSLFEYRVHAGPAMIRNHHGCITLDDVDGGCRVTWTVRMEFVFPGVGRLVRRGLRTELSKSLDALAREAVEPPAPSGDASAATRAAVVDLEPLRDDALGTLAIQLEVARELASDGDPKQWFARVYSIVTDEMIKLVDGGTLQHPDWVLRLIPNFHVHYVRNLEAYQAGGLVDPPWQRAWSMCEAVNAEHPIRPVISGLLAGVTAHIESDLPRSLAQVYLDGYRDSHHYKDFRSDYLAMAVVFGLASDRLLAEMPESYKPWWVRASAALPLELRSALLNRNTFDIPTARLAAFGSGYELVRRDGTQLGGGVGVHGVHE